MTAMTTTSPLALLVVALAALVHLALAVRSTNQMDNAKLSHFEGPSMRIQQLDERVSASAKEQIDDIWDKILADDDTPAPTPSKLAPLTLMSYVTQLPIVGRVIGWLGLLEDLTTTFSTVQDHPLPPKHIKAIHPIGSVAKVSLVWDDDMVKKLGYTGVFSKQQDNVLLRAGPAGALKDKGMAPGIGLKVFRDNQESVNTLMLYSLRGQEGFSHFKHTLCNKLSDLQNKSFAEDLLLKSFKMASKYPFTTGLSQWAEDSSVGDWSHFPWNLCFRPVDAVRKEFEIMDDFQFSHIQEQLMFLEPKTKIYEICAASEPRTQPVKIGDVVMKTEFHRTKFGDTQLFFRHQKFEDDLELYKRDWLKFVNDEELYKRDWLKFVNDEDFWYEEGPDHFYKTIDPGYTGEAPRYGGANAWVGGYDPPTVQQLASDASSLNPGSMLQNDGP